MKRVVLCAVALFVVFTVMAESPKEVDNSTVDRFDLERYMGQWYEIARFDHFFERDMIKVQAKYTLLPDGTVRVENSGYKGDKYRMTRGRAKVARDGEPGLLRVKFVLFYSDYRVLALDQENYSYALVGSSSPKYLWILSRTPKLPVRVVNGLIEEAARRGYDTDQLIFVDQR